MIPLLSSRRSAPLIVLTAFTVTILFLRLTSNPQPWRERIPQAVGLGEFYGDTVTDSYEDEIEIETNGTNEAPWRLPLKPVFESGQTKPKNYKYTRTLVMPRMKSENVDWVEEQLPDLDTAIYIADDPDALFHVPKNKGHEVMIYFTYIIDHYDKLPDTVIFMHSHRYAWHNNEILGLDAVEMLKRLSSERVQREGYMNLRCHWHPGCPAWMHPGIIDEDLNRPEETLIAQSWSEIFPSDPIPLVLAQPCCAQFALSRDRIQAHPLSTYVFYRDWLLRTELTDYLSGRVWEYLWQVVFTGNGSYCPLQSVCYCDGYGVCFGGEDKFDEFYEVRNKKNALEMELKAWKDKAQKIEDLKNGGNLNEAAILEVPELGKDVELEYKIRALQQDLESRRDQAIIRGQDPKIRAQESNRTWHEGDGF